MDLYSNKQFLSCSEYMASKKFRSVWDLRIENLFHIQYFGRYISYFTCLLGKYRTSRQSRNWTIFHHG